MLNIIQNYKITFVHIIQVLLPKIALFPLDYQIAHNTTVQVGDIIQVSFRNKIVSGIVWGINQNSKISKLKTIHISTDPLYRINSSSLEMISRASNYYLASLGSIAKLVLPVEIYEAPNKVLIQELPNQFNIATLTDDQQFALEKLSQNKSPALIKGVTGSGKTEIYFHAILKALKENKQCLILLPEIAILGQIVERFQKSFGFEAAVWHSNVTKAQKKKILRGILTEQVKVVIGTRSSLFLPYKNLGLIIVDEEHDTSYKQSDNIMYNARDMAVLLGSVTGAKTVLVSATPSIESLQNAIDNKYELIEIKNRYNKALLPKVEIVDMRRADLKQNSWLSNKLIEEIKVRLDKGEQSLLFLNRRGYAPLMLCKSCGYRFECKNCSTSMIFHKKHKRMECHYCGNQTKVHQNCFECGESDLTLSGPGIERIEEEVKNLFPSAKIAVLSSEQSANIEEMAKILLRMENKDVDILIGTQIITKGYHFPNLTLVGIVDADMGLFGGDFRSTEHNFQLLHQVGGRAGRAQKEGLVLMQTYNPDNKVIKALCAQTESDFINFELETRRAANMPPFSRMAAIALTGKNEQKTRDMARDFFSRAPKSEAKILGPAEAVIFKIAGKYRYRILVIANKKFNLQQYLSLWLSDVKIPSTIQVKIDIDPQQIM